MEDKRAYKQTPERNKTHYSTGEEFDLNEGFVEPYSIHYSKEKGSNIGGNSIIYLS